MTSLRAHIASSLRLTSEQAIEDVFTFTLSYLTGGLQAYAYQNVIRPHCKSMSAIKFRLSLCASRYFIQAVKSWCFVTSMQVSPSSHYRRLFNEFGIHQEDRGMMRRAFEASPRWRKRLRAVARSASHGLSNKALDTLLAAVTPDVVKYIKMITYKKLRFICKSQNVTLSDLEGDILCKCLQAFYMLVPTSMPELYVTNYLRRSAHNHAMNIIQSNTTEGRGRLVSTNADNSQFSLVVVSQNQILARTAEGEEVEYDSLGKHEPKFELEYSVREVLDKYRHKKKAYRFLLILMGEVDQEFTDWLMERRHLRIGEDNHDLQNRVPVVEFNRLVSQFLNVAEEKTNVFLLKVKRELGYDCRSKAA